MRLLQTLIASILLTTIVTGCASLPEEVEHTAVPLVEQTSSTLSELTHSHQSQNATSKMSAVLIQNSGWDALAQRLALIETAEQTIDIQYYIWNADASGQYLASRLIAAADRGVKVRVMLDDINLNERESLLAALDSHPQIEIRIFNPIPSRAGLTKWFSFMSDFSRLNRRMHNKSFTVDGALSVVGGRNIGDEYFDLSDHINFRDRDVLVMGKVVTDIQASFAQYWNSQWSYPVSLLTDDVAELALIDADKPSAPLYQHYPALPEGNKTAQEFLKNLMPDMVSVEAHFMSDKPVPLDVSNTNEAKATARLLAELAQQSEQEVLIESAYLILDDSQLAQLQKLTDRGIQVKALTNSMASNDLLTNHSGYAGQRQEMLEHGMQLFELKPDTSLCEASTKDKHKCAPTISYGLHAKSAVFDNKIATIGSFNFNLRSTYLNTESLLIIEDQRIAEKLAADIEQAMLEKNSWRVDLVDGDLQWYSGEEVWESEPETGQWERIKSGFLQLLPIEKYL